MASISILLPNLDVGGVERIRIVLAHEFARAGHEVEFVLMQSQGELLEETRASFPTVDLATPRFRDVPLALAQYLRKHRPDALLAAMWPLTGIAGFATLLSGNRTRLVASEHVDLRVAPSLKAYERLLLKHFGRLVYAPCHRVVCVSSGVCESLSDVAGLQAKELSVIHNPVRETVPDDITTQDRAKISGWLNGKRRLIAVGSLKPAKGFDVLLRAIAEINKEEDVKLLVLGEGGLRKELQDLANDLGVSDSVWLAGFRSNPATYLAYADCFVLSSNWEGFGNVLVEALSVGVPVVSTNCPSGPAEILANGQYGILTTPGNWEELARAVLDTLASHNDAERLKSRAEDFKPKQQAAAYLELLTGE